MGIMCMSFWVIELFKGSNVGVMMGMLLFDLLFLFYVILFRNFQDDIMLDGFLKVQLRYEFGIVELFYRIGIEYGYLGYSICFEVLYGYYRIYYL